jgi:uncharacterized protein DUF222/HNH endonuclease
MLGVGGTELSELQAATANFQARQDRPVDLKGLRAVIDALEAEFSTEARRVQAGGEHLADGSATVVTWLSRLCGMSASSAADRLCVGQQLESLPKLAQALSSGEIGYQSASLLCHLRDQLGEKRDRFDEEQMLELARQHSVGSLRFLCRYARHVADPDGFFADAQADYRRRRLHISPLVDGMQVIDGLLDAEGGAVLRTALEGLSRRRGPDDERTHGQRMADALVELVQHALEEGRLPRRQGVKPHLTVTTTLEGLKNQLGAPAADLELSLPISTRTLERIACDSSISRVLLADSMVVDVGRATRVVSAPLRRALRVRDQGCRWPGCDRQVSWSSPHHIVHWAKDGPTHPSNLVLLCYFHHRLVHEGGWQVVKAGREFRFVPPDRVVMRRVRGPGLRWAA